jgi:Asp-tRNA(Asn)/Glu-tRNA(Gln) amidotransferase A subunit family amidase
LAVNGASTLYGGFAAPNIMVKSLINANLCDHIASQSGGSFMDSKIAAHSSPVRRGMMLSALDLARRIEAGELTPAAVVDMCAQAIAAYEPDIGAFAYLDVAGAQQRAVSASATLAASPLRGLPVAFKDIFDTFDMPTAYGSAIYDGNQPSADASLAAMARRAGANILGKTVSTPFAFLDPAQTKNPHNLGHTPGGSSSGSAAAVAAGMVPIAVGTQTGGSVIRPAAYCGVAGYKPSYRMLPTVGIKCFSWSLDTPGFFTASVADVAFAAGAISGRDLRVDQSKPKPPNLALMRTHIWSQASPAMQTAVEDTARAVERAGGRVTELKLPAILEEAFEIHGTIQSYEAARALAFEYDHYRDRLPKLLRELLDSASKISTSDYDNARRVAKRARSAFVEIIASVDGLLTPSAPGAAPASLDSTGPATFNRLWTLVGAPCVNVPGKVDSQNLPLGIQVVGRFGRDKATLEAAQFVEAAIAAR